MAFVKVTTVQEVPAGTAKSVQVQGRTVAVFHVDGAVYAIDDTCPHRGAPLSEGVVEGTEVECPWHAARFDLRTGAHQCPPARSDVKAYPARIVGGDIELDIA